MLERVAISQVQFRIPGLAADARGVALGKTGVLLFASLDQVVGFFRLYTAEASLEDIHAQLRIVRVRTPLASREYLVLLPALSSTALDRVSKLSSTLGGLTFTGTNKHFVQYRDERAPLGYDAHEIYQGDGDFVLYGESFTQAYVRDRDIPFAQLLFRLSLVRLPGGEERLTAGELGGGLFLRVSAGLAQVVSSYLWRNRVRAQATYVGPPAAVGPVTATTPPGAAGGTAAYLVRVDALPERMLKLFSSVPGIELYRPWTDRVAIELGYRHPFTLESCSPAFERDRLYLFAGRRDTVEVIPGPPQLIDIAHLVKLGFRALAGAGAEGGGEERTATVQPQVVDAPVLRMELSLVPGAPRRRVTALLMPMSHAPVLKRVVFNLPPSLLVAYQVAFTEQTIVLLNPGGAEGIALGTLMQEFGPNLYVPLGHTLVPRVRPEVLAEQIGAREGFAYFFPAEGGPFALPLAGFRPLERRVLSGLELPVREIDDGDWLTPLGAGEVEVQMGEAGVFPLWGLPRGRRQGGTTGSEPDAEVEAEGELGLEHDGAGPDRMLEHRPDESGEVEVEPDQPEPAAGAAPAGGEETASEAAEPLRRPRQARP